MKKFPMMLAAVLTAVIAWSAYNPAEWGVWWMEMSWVLGVFALLAFPIGVSGSRISLTRSSSSGS